MPEFSQLETLLEKYFPGKLSITQISQFRIAFSAIIDWNEKVNLISRKDLENLAERHFLHSLAIAKAIDFPARTSVIDVGTGGGFPGIPLAIFFPETRFLLVDSIGKKMKVVADIVQQCELKNIRTATQRAENVAERFDYAVSRAVAPLPDFIEWLGGKIRCNQQLPLKGGILYLKGESWKSEIPVGAVWAKEIREFPLTKMFDEEFFLTKTLVHVPLCK